MANAQAEGFATLCKSGIEHPPGISHIDVPKSTFMKAFKHQ